MTRPAKIDKGVWKNHFSLINPCIFDFEFCVCTMLYGRAHLDWTYYYVTDEDIDIRMDWYCKPLAKHILAKGGK